MSNNIFTISQRDIKTALMAGHHTKKTVMLYGPAGCSKSVQAMQFAREILEDAIDKETDPEDKAYLESLRGNTMSGAPKNFVDVRLATESPESVKGVIIPVEHEDGSLTSQVAYNGRYPTDPRWVGVILFDELSSAAPSMQSVAYQALNDRKIEALEFPKGAAIVAAGNRKDDGGLHFDLLKPVTNRVIIFEIEPNAMHWVEDFAIPNNIHHSITSFIASQEGFIYNGDQLSEDQSFSSMRSLEAASNLIKMKEECLIDRSFLNIALAGTIGQTASSAWSIHYDLGAKLPKISDIVAGKSPSIGVDSDQLSSAYYYICYSCLLHYIGKYNDLSVSKEELLKQLNNIFSYFEEKMPDQEDIHTGFAFQFRKYALDNRKVREGFGLDILHEVPALKKMVKVKIELDQKIASGEV